MPAEAVGYGMAGILLYEYSVFGKHSRFGKAPRAWAVRSVGAKLGGKVMQPQRDFLGTVPYRLSRDAHWRPASLSWRERRLFKNSLRHVGLILSVVAGLLSGENVFAVQVNAADPNKKQATSNATDRSNQSVRDASASCDRYEVAFPSMGTQVKLIAWSDDRQKVTDAFLAAQKRVHTLVAILSDYDPTSEVSRLNRGQLHVPQTISRDLQRVLIASGDWNTRAHGALDVSFGNLTAYWRKIRRSKRAPERLEIQKQLERCGWERVVFEPSDATVVLNDVRLDLGAIAKGYIIDQVFEQLVDAGFPCCLVDAGGDMRLGQAPPDQPGWRVRVKDLLRSGATEQQTTEQKDVGGAPEDLDLTLTHCAIATSGDLFQYVEFEGKRYSHILDPDTGWGIEGRRSATVIAPTAMDADAAATALCILGEAGRFLGDLEGVHCQYVSLPASETKQSDTSKANAMERSYLATGLFRQ